MSFHEVSLPPKHSWGSRGGPRFNTKILETDSGAEERISRWANPRRIFDLSESVQTYQDLYDIYTFFLARKGSAFGFRLKDWVDYASTADGKTLAPNGFGQANVSHQDQNIATGDGVETQFQLVKRYTSGPTTYVRNITKPVDGTVVVAFAGVQQTSGWSIDTTTGILTFTTPPPISTLIRAGFEFEVPVRFGTEVDEGGLQTAMEDFGSGSIPNIPCYELFDEYGADDEYPYRGCRRFGNIAEDRTISHGNGAVQSFSPTVGGLRLFLPEADNLPTGGVHFWIVNEGAFDVDLKTAYDTLLITIPVSSRATVVLSEDPNGVRTWLAW